MTTFSLILLIILVFQDIIILNEETLILVCFIVFIWLLYNNQKEIINQEFSNRSITIKKELQNSLSTYVTLLESNLKKKKELQELQNSFENLRKHLVSFNIQLIIKTPNYILENYKKLFVKKLTHLKNLEEQTFKLISILLIKKIEKIVHIEYFYIRKLKLKNFLSVSKVITREYFNLIK